MEIYLTNFNILNLLHNYETHFYYTDKFILQN
jgi:hypothetical protein